MSAEAQASSPTAEPAVAGASDLDQASAAVAAASVVEPAAAALAEVLEAAASGQAGSDQAEVDQASAAGQEAVSEAALQPRHLPTHHSRNNGITSGLRHFPNNCSLFWHPTGWLFLEGKST